MNKLLIALMLGSSQLTFADSFNSISLQGELTPPTPIYGVGVHILSAGQVVGTASDVDLVPDANGIFSTQTYITNPWVFRTGSDYIMRLSSPTSGAIISTFSITAVPFALTVRGDSQTGDQNTFSAYGNVGIGTDSPAYRLVVSSGGSDLMWVASDGVHATKFTGDGSGLTNVSGTGDNLGNHTATQDLAMAGYKITNAGDISGAIYQVNGSTLLSRGGQLRDLFLGVDAGSDMGFDSSGYNTFLGDSTGERSTGGGNVYVGLDAGSFASNDLSISIGLRAGQGNHGIDNIFLGADAGADYNGSGNIIIGNDQQLPQNYTDHHLNLGGVLFGNLQNRNIGIGVPIPQYRLSVSGNAGDGGDIVVVSTGTSELVRVNGYGEIYAAKYYGDGTGLAALNASNFTSGTVADARLSSNVELLDANRTISGVKTFLSSMTIIANAFSVGGSTLVVQNGMIGIGTPTPGAKLDVSEVGTGSSLVVKDDGLKVQEIYNGGVVSFPRQSRMRAYLGSDLTITNNTFTKVPFSMENFDEQGEYDSTTNYRFTAKTSGYYLIASSLYIHNGSWPIRGVLLVKKNGSAWLCQNESRIDTYDSGNYSSPAISDVAYLSADDYIEVFVYMASNSNKTLLGGSYFTWVAVHKIS